VVDANEILLEVAGGQADSVERALVHYRVAAPVRFARPGSAVMAVLGPRAAEALGDGGLRDLALESHAMVDVANARVRVIRAGDLPAAGFALHVPPDAREPVMAALREKGAAPIGAAVVDVLRIEDGRPWFGPDVTADNLLHETGLVKELHSPAKGCYVGQEVIARLEARGGNVNKLLRGLRLAAPCAAGDTIRALGKDVGRVTTAGISPALGAIAMGYVHRGAAEPGTPVEAGAVSATVARLPLGER
jgi:folate-binding protein YgfZ